MRQRLASVSLRNSALHLRQEVETLDGVLDGGVWRQLLNGLENFLLDTYGYHFEPPIRCDRLRLWYPYKGLLLKGQGRVGH